MATFDLENLGGTWPAQRPAVTAHPGRLDIFMVGGNQELYHYWINTEEPYGLESLGGSFKVQSVSATTRESTLDVFAVGTDNKLYHYYQSPGRPFNHETVADGFVNPNLLKAVSSDGRRWDVFVTGSSNFSLDHYWWPRPPAGVFSLETGFGHESLGGTLTTGTSLSATAWPNRLDVFFLEPSRGPVHFWQNAGESFRSESMPDPYWQDTSLEAVSWGPGRLDVFTAKISITSGSIEHFWQQSSGWAHETVATLNTGGTTTNPRRWPIAAASWGSPRVDFFTTFGAGTPLYHHWQDGTPFQHEKLGGTWRHGFDAVSWGARRLDVFAVGDDDELYHYWQG